MGKNSVSLKEHFEALRRSDQEAIDLVREWVKERLDSHNDLLKKWEAATEKDRQSFARQETLEALKREFFTYKEITAKALTLAEGQNKGFDMVKGSVTFVAGLMIAGLAMWAALKG
jgi:hypothetical protein